MLHALSLLDYQLLLEATNFTAAHPLLQVIVYICAQLLILVFPVVLFVLWKKPEIKGDHHTARKAVMIAVVCLVLGLAIKEGVGFLYLRERPFLAHPDLLAMRFRVDPESFPSGHSLLAFAISWSLYLSGYKKLGLYLLILSLLVGLGRVFSGVHYPSDVLGGALIGIASAWYLHREASSIKRYLPNQ